MSGAKQEFSEREVAIADAALVRTGVGLWRCTCIYYRLSRTAACSPTWGIRCGWDGIGGYWGDRREECDRDY